MTYQLILQLGLFFCLLSIIWQDFRHRSIHIGILFGFSLLAACYGYSQLSIKSWLYSFSCNGTFIVFQLLGISFYYRLKTKRWVWIADHYLGWGDIWFWAALALMLPSITFIGFYVGSLIGVLIGVVLYQFFLLLSTKKKEEKQEWTIPLAGGQAIALLLFICYENLAFKI